MTPDTIPISPATQSTLLALAARTGRPPGELLDAAVKALSERLVTPVESIPGVDPADVWAAAAEADAGKLTPHAEVFARRRARK